LGKSTETVHAVLIPANFPSLHESPESDARPPSYGSSDEIADDSSSRTTASSSSSWTTVSTSSFADTTAVEDLEAQRGEAAYAAQEVPTVQATPFFSPKHWPFIVLILVGVVKLVELLDGKKKQSP